jgi:hypothetical protein
MSSESLSSGSVGFDLLAKARLIPCTSLGTVFWQVFAILVSRRINNLRDINRAGKFDSHPGHHF